MSALIRKPLLWWKARSRRTKGILAAVLVLIVFLLVKGKGADDSVTIETVERQTLTNTVLASGTVVSSTDLSLSFEANKMIDSVRVKVGDTVKKGDILATQKNGTERASYSSARGALLAAQARYDKVLDGSSNEEIALAITALESAKKDLEQTKRVQNGLVENARRRLNSEGLVAEPEHSGITNTPTISGTYTGPEGEYRISPQTLNGKTLRITGLENTTASISATTPQPLGTRGLYIIFPNKDDFSNGEGWKVIIPNTSSSSYVQNSTAYAAAKDARDAAVVSAEALVSQREAELNLKRATARQPEIDAALADIVSARAQVESANAQLEKTILRAPADGTITKVDVKVGEVPEAFKEVLVLQDVSNLYLEASINENQIKDVVVGQPATVTFGAFEGEIFQATISSVDPAATITDNIVNYNMKALLLESSMIRPGMTADISVVTDEVANTLVIPLRALTLKDGAYTAEKVVDERKQKTQSVRVVIGMKGDGNMVEVLEGLQEGDKVLWEVQ